MTQPQQEQEDAGRWIGGRYVIEELLGRGGMATVYRARDTRTGRLVAVKRGVARDPRKRIKRQALLQREYYTLCQLQHPRIIEVYDYGLDERGPYYVMELLDGSDLDGGGQQPWRRASALLYDVASSLSILHARGLVHRDVSTRNVRCTADGRAKLIDFGAMVSTGGVPKDVVGTPPFMAPEVLQMQTLDGRADLFSLGALGYFLLTGRHAYPARRLKDLRDAWRSRPAPPSRRVPDVPPALSDLLIALLALDRNARPQTAAEVMSRLCAIAQLPVEEASAVSHAYLVTPTLVGRESALIAARKRLLSLARDDGGVMLIQGVAGSGRSRFLDACAIEAKLLGAAVLRADASDAESGDFGVMRAIGSQLLELMPQEAAQAARLSRSVLVHVLDELAGEDFSSASLSVPDRSLLVRELRDFILTLSRRQELLIVVDDFDRADEPSQAVIAALAQKAERHPIVLAIALDREVDPTPAVQLLRSLT
ncbi:MAG TPA: serine/threonine-protein kinase, partial [Polyangiales bacterium]|nr:serine/threonine-protein kinase [Polyangiales bacterium]